MAAATKAQSRLKKAELAAISGERCLICHMELDGVDPEEMCPKCDLLLHSDCLRGDGCPECDGQSRGVGAATEGFIYQDFSDGDSD